MIMGTVYDTLGVAPAASPEVVKAAYRVMLRTWHPDVNPSVEAKARTAAITEAFDTLADPTRRAEYDRSVINAPPAPPVYTPAGGQQRSAHQEPAGSTAGADARRFTPARIRKHRWGGLGWVTVGLGGAGVAGLTSYAITLNQHSADHSGVVALIFALACTAAIVFGTKTRYPVLGGITLVLLSPFCTSTSNSVVALAGLLAPILLAVAGYLMRYGLLRRFRRYKNALLWESMRAFATAHPDTDIFFVSRSDPNVNGGCTALLMPMAGDWVTRTLWDRVPSGVWALISASGVVTITAPADAGAAWNKLAEY